MIRLLYYYPIILTGIGVGIHSLGTIGSFQEEQSPIIHAIMLAVDLLVVIGLLKRTLWGYWVAILLYIEQSIMQPYWGYLSFTQGSWYQLAVVCPLVIAALAVLVFNKRLFVRH
jgi:hypothetical protein